MLIKGYIIPNEFHEGVSFPISRKAFLTHFILFISYLWSISYGPLVMDHIILLEKRINSIIKANLRTIPGIKRHLEVIFSTAFLRSDNDPDHARV